MVHFTSITGSQRVLRQDLADHILVQKIAENSDFPGENVFINATPANFSANEVPRAGEIIYSLDELKQIVQIYHNLGKKIGCHVAGEKGIEMALAAGFNCLHHAHGISKEQLKHAKTSGVHIVATPLGGTHLKPNSPEEIAQMLAHRIPVSIATDSYLPPYPNVPWLHFSDQTVKGPDTLMKISQPTMRLLKDSFDENDLLALITANPAKLLGKEDRFGRLEVGLEANFLVVEGIPGLEITDIEKIKHVYYQGKKIIDRTILS